MLTGILSRTVTELSQLIVKILDTAFLSPIGGLGTTYDVHLELIGKRAVDFLYSVNWTFFRKVLLLRRYGRK